MNKSQDTGRFLEDAELALKKSKRKEYYMILGMDRNTSPDEIKKAYKNKARIHHPDHHMNASEAKRKEEEKNFKKVCEVFATLSNPEERACHDSKCTEEAIEDTGSTFNWNGAHRACFTIPNLLSTFNKSL
jgi:DnaJ family protein C protein 7